MWNIAKADYAEVMAQDSNLLLIVDERMLCLDSGREIDAFSRVCETLGEDSEHKWGEGRNNLQLLSCSDDHSLPSM